MRRLPGPQPSMGQLELRDIPMHAMRVNTSQAWNSHLQGQVAEHGHVDWRTSAGA